jgi:predicted RNase H-like HicB family nuclease
MIVPYTYRVTRGADDSTWLATCAEFPGLSHLSADAHDAMAGIQRLVADAVAEMQAAGEAVPTPRAA